jgi:hypothetical protein
VVISCSRGAAAPPLDRPLVLMQKKQLKIMNQGQNQGHRGHSSLQQRGVPGDQEARAQIQRHPVTAAADRDDEQQPCDERRPRGS